MCQFTCCLKSKTKSSEHICDKLDIAVFTTKLLDKNIISLQGLMSVTAKGGIEVCSRENDARLRG